VRAAEHGALVGISAVRRGREKLHDPNPVPVHDIQQRWIAPFDQPRLRALDAIKRHAEELSRTRRSSG
jgi:hypothetical protein